jgi:hypothetical protein
MIQARVEGIQCAPRVERVGNVLLIVLFIIAAVKLAKVHDGYFLKNELKALGIIVLFYGDPVITTYDFMSENPSYKYLGPALSMWLLVFLSNIHFYL